MCQLFNMAPERSGPWKGRAMPTVLEGHLEMEIEELEVGILTQEKEVQRLRAEMRQEDESLQTKRKKLATARDLVGILDGTKQVEHNSRSDGEVKPRYPEDAS